MLFCLSYSRNQFAEINVILICRTEECSGYVYTRHAIVEEQKYVGRTSVWYLYLGGFVRIRKGSVEVLFVYIWNRKSSVEVARVRSWFLKVRVQPWAKITRGRAVFVIPGLKERDAANNYNCICSVFLLHCLSVFSCHTSNIYYHFKISSRSTRLPETSKICASQILRLNPTIVFTCHAGPVFHQSRCDGSL